MREVDHSPPSSVEVKNEWRYTSVPSIYLCGVDRDTYLYFCCNRESVLMHFPVISFNESKERNDSVKI